MRELQINWLRKCRVCGNNEHTVVTIKGTYKSLWDDDDVTCNKCGLKGIVRVIEGFAGVLWQTDEELLQ